MRLFPAVLLVPACLLMVVLGSGWSRSSASAEAIGIEPVVWQFGEDYPGAHADDAALGVRTVYIKTHDGTDWMSTYDATPNAVSGPEAIRRLIEAYGARGIGVVAWFVPQGRDVAGQLQRAKEVLDSGVQGLYADLEPYQGFCHLDCAFLADNFWAPLRAERPSARLGVIYDPRPWWWAGSATSAWLASADVALPMCYWETFADQGVWADPAGCVRQAHADLGVLAPGRGLDYVPMLQGDSVPGKVAAAVDAAASSGASRVSIWRRGVMSSDVWAVAAARAGASARPCAESRADGCLLADQSSGRVYVMHGGAKFYVPSPEVFAALGLDGAAVQPAAGEAIQGIPDVPRDGTLLRELNSPAVYMMAAGARFSVPDPRALASVAADPAWVRVVPDGALRALPLVPGDGALLREAGSSEVYVVLAGARFHIPDEVAFKRMGLDWADVARVAPGSLKQVSLLPRDRAWFTELGTGRHWLVQRGVKFNVDSSELRSALIRAGQMEPRLYVVPPNGMGQVPGVEPPRRRGTGPPP